jgi:uncharacterized membrane protein (DUF106 family)
MMTLSLEDVVTGSIEKVGIIAVLVGAISAFARRVVVPRSAYDELKEDRDEWVQRYRELADKLALVQQVLSDRRQP